MRRASYVPGELIPLPLSGSIPELPHILYLAALSATRFNADMRVFYKRLTTSGKPAKVALIAVARKLAVLANILVHEDRVWEHHMPRHA